MHAGPATPVPSIDLRLAKRDDAQFVAHVYGRAMGPVLHAAGLDLAQQEASLPAQWRPAEIRIIRAVRRDVGWIQVTATEDGQFIRNFCIDPEWQKLGIGSTVLRMILAEATERSDAVALAVTRGNPARNLFELFGFRVTHEDAQHHYMRWLRDSGAFSSHNS